MGNSTATAILFVGSKYDRSLLGIGMLTAVDGDTVNLDITDTTNNVTFTVAALETRAPVYTSRTNS
jgi:hypothetical protein